VSGFGARPVTTSFVVIDPDGPPPSGIVPNTVEVKLPAPDAIKGGVAMFLLGVVGFALRRDIDWQMRWYPRPSEPDPYAQPVPMTWTYRIDPDTGEVTPIEED